MEGWMRRCQRKIPVSHKKFTCGSLPRSESQLHPFDGRTLLEKRDLRGPTQTLNLITSSEYQGIPPTLSEAHGPFYVTFCPSADRQQANDQTPSRACATTTKSQQNINISIVLRGSIARGIVWNMCGTLDPLRLFGLNRDPCRAGGF
ncbi:hypothetical protein I7I51_08556 [Histoplasma capsulatum]|uniref:Uncharacterized protein n=1 Tax=Ajellomyces capsulatus TaxID=5037 RepID=A0A8A1M374_AJECA|nr:hypothetical protein I7I51_08556 [Histoplasma capsulatum]